MKHDRDERRSTWLAGATFLLAFMLTAPAPIFAQKEEPPPETHDGLTLVPDRKVAAAYVDPEADFSTYDKIMILDCYVAFKKNWLRDQRASSMHTHVSSGDMEKIRVELAELFRDVFAENLGKDGGYEIVDDPGDDVLLVRPAIIDLDITAPDTMSSGQSRTYTTTSGAATIYIELYDSVTGDILARATDRRATRSAGHQLRYTSRVSNRADARRTLGAWANLLRDRLDEFHGK